MNNWSLIKASVLGLAVFSLLTVAPAHATAWVGNDNGEFQTSNIPSYVSVQDVFSGPMQWLSSPPYDYISLQYNPDRTVSYLLSGEWVQALIWTEPGGCAAFSIQIYQVSTGIELFQTDYPGAPNYCNVVNGMLTAGANWFIQEDVSYNNIQDIQFSVNSMSHTLYPDLNYFWVRSNVCWCGVSGGYATFSAAYGTNTISSDQNVQTIDPPIFIATQEDSNMPYGQWSGAGTLSMSQTFGIAPSSYGGGGSNLHGAHCMPQPCPV